MKPFKFSFSYSRWSLWRKCPKAFKLQHVDKLPMETGEALLKGRRIHDEIAGYLEGKTTEQPKSLSKKFAIMGAQIAGVPSGDMLVEKQMAFDKDSRPVGWFGANAYFRFIWDVGITASPTEVQAVDWKTGRPYDSYDDQKQMFALPAFWLNPNLESFTGHWVYLDHGDVHTTTFTRDQVYGPTGDPAANDGLHGMWKANAAMMESDIAFRPTPSREACKWCEFGPNKQNICAEGVM